MPQYTVPITGPDGGAGSITVNASDSASATQNASQGGNTPTGAPVAAGGGGSGNASTGGGGGSSGGGGGGGGGNKPVGTNPALDTAILNNLQQKAYQEYLNAKLQLDTDQEAYQKAAQAIANDIAIAGVSGSYQGMPTQAALKQIADIAQQQAQTMLSYATTFGSWGMPQTGQQTLAAQKQQFDESTTAAGLTGWYTPTTYTPPQMGGVPNNIGLAPAPTNTGNMAMDAFNYKANQNDQKTYLDAEQGDRARAAEHYFRDVTGAVQAAVQNAGGQWTGSSLSDWVYGTTAVPQNQQPGQPGQVAAGQPGAQGSVTYGAPPGWQQGQPIQTLVGNEQAYTQWLRAQQQSLAQWQAQQTASQNYLTMMAGLRGPADWQQYQKVLGATPGGMKDLVAAAAGQYIPGGGATTGVQPTAVNMQNFLGSATGQGAADTSGQAAMNSLVAPNQMAPQTWNALTPSQQQMLLGTWESQGYSMDDAKALFSQSLPKYATAAPSGGQFRLQ